MSIGWGGDRDPSFTSSFSGSFASCPGAGVGERREHSALQLPHQQFGGGVVSEAKALWGKTSLRLEKHQCTKQVKRALSVSLSQLATQLGWTALGPGPSELALIQQLPEPIADLGPVLSEVWPIEGREQAGVGEVVEHVADAAMGLGREVVRH